MDCERFNKFLDNYENLNEEEKTEMTAHADECESCRRELDFMLSIIEITKSLPEIKPPSDFMDKLNIRIDMEEKKQRLIAKRMLMNVRRNWKQYTAAAACFALVAVVTANSRSLVDKMSGYDDGVIQEETVVTDNTSPEIEQATNIQNEETEGGVSSTPIDEDTSAVIDNARQSEVFSGASAKNNSVDTAPVKQAAATPAVSTVKSPSPVSYETESVKAEVTPETAAPVIDEPAAEIRSEDYGIASADVSPDDTDMAYNSRSIAYNPAETEISAQSEDNIEENYSLARDGAIIANGYYYSSNNSPIRDEDKAIGKLKISPEDAEEAMDVILLYSHGINDEIYSTNSASLSMMLSRLSQKGVSYVNYIPAYEGDIAFQLVIG